MEVEAARMLTGVATVSRIDVAVNVLIIPDLYRRPWKMIRAKEKQTQIIALRQKSTTH